MGRITKAVMRKSVTSPNSSRNTPLKIRRQIPASVNLEYLENSKSDFELQTQLENKKKLGHNLANISIFSEQSLQKSLKKDGQSIHTQNCGCPVCNSGTLNIQRTPLLNNKGATKPASYPQVEGQKKVTDVIANQVNPRIQRGLWGKIKKGVKKVGGWIKSGAKKVANVIWTGVKWVSSQLWSKLKGIFLRVIRWITQLPNRIGRLLLHIWEGVKSLKPWSLEWWKSLGKISTWKGLLKWLGNVLIDLLEIAGVGEVYETLADFIKFNTRPLNGSEIAKARIVFGSAINYNLVRVDEYALLGPSWTGRAYVSFHTINNWGTLDDHTLIHELTHVWQYEKMGAIYMPKAIHAQNTPEGYNYSIQDLQNRRAAKQGFRSFNLEQQGQILADYYIGKTTNSFSQATLNLYEYFVSDVRE